MFTYDQVGRTLTNTEQITGMNGVAQTAVTLSSLKYNQVGQLHIKYVGNSLQTIIYGYNERGWMTTMSPQVSAPGLGNYAETIYYNSPTGTATPRYNGNISQFVYNSPHMEGNNGHTGTATNTVNYTYDYLNRLTQSQSTLGLTDETLTYDLEGNINSLARSGTGVNTGTLGYAYTTGTNQLASVTQNGTSFKQYHYDGNGNATSDSTTKTLTYNLLNLPMTYTLNGTTRATYYYESDGNKLRDVSTSYGTWDYIGGIVYLNENISFINTEEGRASLWADSLYHYSYNLTDYLGNVRANYADSSNALQIIQENDYYSFGLTVKTYDNASGNRYLYNGKEEQYDLTNQYDFGARFDNPVIGRWDVVDPLAEKFRRLSPYVYGGDNPIRFVDPDGMGYEPTRWLPPEVNGRALYIAAGAGGSRGSRPNDWVRLLSGRYFFDKKVHSTADARRLYGDDARDISGEVWTHKGIPYRFSPKGAKTPWVVRADDLIWNNSTGTGPMFTYGFSAKGMGDLASLLEFTTGLIGGGIGGVEAGATTLLDDGGSEAIEQGTHTVYQGLENGVVKYVGITERDVSLRWAEHAASGTARAWLDYEVVPGATGLTKQSARIMEQNLINQYGLNSLLNKINSIAPKYWGGFSITP